MPAPFAVLESRVNAAVIGRLANVTALLDGVEVEGIFDDAYVRAGVGVVGMDTARPMLQLRSDQVPEDPEDLVCVVRGIEYRVAECHPDGAGMTELLLDLPGGVA